MGSSRVGFVGAGRMGLPMVERLAAAGHDLVAYARRPETQDALTGLGVRHTTELPEAAAGAGVLLLCVFTDEQLAEIAGTLAAALPAGAVFASHVTGRESTLRAVAGRFPGIDVVDAPVSGVPDDIRAGRLTVLLGGLLQADRHVLTHEGTDLGGELRHAAPHPGAVARLAAAAHVFERA